MEVSRLCDFSGIICNLYPASQSVLVLNKQATLTAMWFLLKMKYISKTISESTPVVWPYVGLRKHVWISWVVMSAAGRFLPHFKRQLNNKTSILILRLVLCVMPYEIFNNHVSVWVFLLFFFYTVCRGKWWHSYQRQKSLSSPTFVQNWYLLVAKMHLYRTKPGFVMF